MEANVHIDVFASRLTCTDVSSVDSNAVQLLVLTCSRKATVDYYHSRFWLIIVKEAQVLLMTFCSVWVWVSALPTRTLELKQLNGIQPSSILLFALTVTCVLCLVFFLCNLWVRRGGFECSHPRELMLNYLLIVSKYLERLHFKPQCVCCSLKKIQPLWRRIKKNKKKGFKSVSC